MTDILILDGALGTQLESYDLPLSLPIWSADANLNNPEIVTKIHNDYIKAGANVITTNTFRSTPWTYRKSGFSKLKAYNSAKDSFFRAIDCARKASNEEIQIAGAITSVEDCYQPNKYPGKMATEETYGQLLEWFSEAEVDIILFETMGHIEEIKIAIEMTSSILDPIWVSLIMLDEETLLDGTLFLDFFQLFENNNIDSLLLNCNNIDITIEAMKKISNLNIPRFGAYPNLGLKEYQNNFQEIVNRSNFIPKMESLLKTDLGIIGACCGSTPEHIKILKTLINGL